MQNRLHAYLGGVARENNIVALAVGGVADHVHLLLSYAARYAGLGFGLNSHPQLALWATGIIASFAGSAVCRIAEDSGRG
jgi:hypothetical protein